MRDGCYMVVCGGGTSEFCGFRRVNSMFYVLFGGFDDLWRFGLGFV